MRFGPSVNRKPGSEGSADNRTRDHAPTLATFWLRGVLGVALVAFLATVLVVFARVENEKANAARQLRTCSAVAVRDIERHVASLQGRLRRAVADPRLRSALGTRNGEDLGSNEERLAHLLPNARQVRLVKAGACAGQVPTTESLSYAGLDLVCRAERDRKVTLLEVHRLGSPEEHLAIAAPVLDATGKSVLGTVHVALPSSMLTSLEDANGEWGHIELQQRVGDKAVTLGTAGGAAISSGLPDHQASIEGTRLRAAAWVGCGGVPSARLLQFAVLAYLVLVGALALAMWFPLAGLRRALAIDCGGMIGLMEDLVSRKPLRYPRCRLAETKPVLEKLFALLRRLQLTPAAGKGPPAKMAEATLKQAAAVSRGEGVAFTDETPITTGAGLSKHSDLAEPGFGPDQIPARIFSDQGISGIAGRDLTPDVLYAIGLAVGTEADRIGGRTVIVGRDKRPSSRELSESLVSGLRASGRDVLDLGVAPLPLIYFATRYRGETSGAMISGGEDSESLDGVKILLGGEALAGARVKALRERILAGSFSRGEGGYRAGKFVSDYIEQMQEDVAIARTLKVVVDCGNAATALVAPALYPALGCDLVELGCEPDRGSSRDRTPDPTCPGYLENLRQAVRSQGADIGLAFDGDGDRLGVVDSSGKIIWPDRVLMLLAADVLSRYPGADILFDSRCSNRLATEILRHGGRPVVRNSVHESLHAKPGETDALLAGDWSGHICFRERWHGFEDALYAGARLLELLALDPRPSAEVFAALPGALATPEIMLELADGEAGRIMAALREEAKQTAGFDWSSEEGLRAESERGWGYARASSARSALVFRFDADEQAGLSEIQDQLRRIMERMAPECPLPF
jgi:phosphomannomutase/phosphoglucomutase